MRTRLVAPFVIAASLLTSLAFAAPASADERIPLVAPPRDQLAEETVWYGSTSVALDAAAGGSLLIALAASGTDANPLMGAASVGLYMVGPPTVHLAHGHYGRAAASVALRLGLPIALASVGAALAPPCPPDAEICLNGLEEVSAGLLIGVVGAVVIDDFVLAREKRPAGQGAFWAPTITPSGGGLSFGIAGAF